MTSLPALLDVRDPWPHARAVAEARAARPDRTDAAPLEVEVRRALRDREPDVAGDLEAERWLP